MKILKLVIPLLCIAAAETSYGQIAIKGLAIDMNIDDALKIVNERFNEALGNTYTIGEPQAPLFGEAPKGFALIPSKPKSTEGLSEEEKLMQGLQMFAALGALAGAPSAFIVEADEEKKINKVVFPGYLTDKLFNTEDMQPGDFAQEIVNNYDIPTMSPFHIEIGDSFLSGWEYSSPDGTRIRVFEDKSIEMIRIPKKASRSFD